jgi:hypothetical protein
MLHDGYLFDFPGRGYELENADLDRWFAAASMALEAIARVVEPTVVEAIDEQNEIWHLVAGDSRGGSYTRHPTRTEVATRIDAVRLTAWLAKITDGGTVPIASVSIADGWYRVDAAIGDTIRLHESRGKTDVMVRERDGRGAVLAPGDHVIVPPMGFQLDVTTGRLRVAVHWSPWVDRDGCGRAQFDAMGEALTDAGWKLTKQPAAADLDWKRWHAAPIVPLPKRAPTPTAAQPAWIELPATTVVLGLSLAAREQLADVLVAQDRQAVEAEGSLGYREYDEAKRRAEIVAGLAVSLGRSEALVSRCEIMASPVTNAMWSHYMAEVGAQRPASWATTLLPVHDPVTGISYDEAVRFAAHHGWTLPTEAEWQLAASRGTIPIDGANEYTADPFAPYPGGDPAAFATPDLRCLRGTAPQVPPCIPARRGLAHDHRFKFVRFRCVRRS